MRVWRFRWLLLAALGPGGLAAQVPDTTVIRVTAARHRDPVVREFYRARAHAPAWTAAGAPTAAARELAAALDTIDRHGLPPARYEAPGIHALIHGAADSLPVLDVTLTTAFLTAARELAEGRVRPETVDTMWAGQRGAVDVSAALIRAAAGSPAAELAALAPPHAGYHALRTALARYARTARAGGWRELPAGRVLALGDTGPDVVALRDRLAADGDLAWAAGAVCDTACDLAIRRFQARHGLTVDGRVGPRTRAALNVPAAARARQIGLNLERWRWVPRDLGPAPITVSIADYSAARSPDGGERWRSPVIVGRRDWPTPIVAGRLSGIVFAPVWRVPREIALRELLPRARVDTTVAAREGFRLVDSAGAPRPGEWEALADEASGVRLVQLAGPANPLGGVKLVFANDFNVCLHATPNRRAFRATVRTFSHGCVRIEDAAGLAATLLSGDPAWPADAVAQAIRDSVERVVPLPPGTTVVLGYWTAWVAEDGAVHFRPDVYDWDAKLARALR